MGYCNWILLPLQDFRVVPFLLNIGPCSESIDSLSPSLLIGIDFYHLRFKLFFYDLFKVKLDLLLITGVNGYAEDPKNMEI